MSPDAVAAHDGVMSQVAVVADVSMMSGIVARVLRALVFSNSCCNCTGLFIASVTMYSCRSH